MKLYHTSLNDLTVEGGDTMILCTGATVNSVTVFYNGELDVHSGGSVGKLTVSSGGKAVLASGGQAGSAILFSAGKLCIWNKATCSSVELLGGSLDIKEGGRAVLTSFKSGEIDKDPCGTLNLPTPKPDVVCESCKADNPYCDTYESAYVYGKAYNGMRVVLPSGTLGSALTLRDAARLHVTKGAIVTDLEMEPNTICHVEGEGHAIIIKSGSYLRVTGTARSIQVDPGGSLQVCNSGYARNVVIQSGGSVFVSNSARLTTMYICSGGVLELADNATANIVEIGEGGKAILRDNSDLSVFPDSKGNHGTVEIDMQQTARMRLINDQPERSIAANFLTDLEDVPR